MTNLRYILPAIVALTAGTAVFAQGLSTSVTVERNIIPEERAANRLSDYRPTIYTPKLPTVNLLQDEYAGTAAIVPGFVPLDPSPWPLALKRSKQRGYAVVGYLPLYNLAASAGYRFVENDTTSAGVWAQFDGAIWHSAPEGGVRSLYRTNTVTAGADASHRFNSHSTLAVRADYTRAWLHRPGSVRDFDQGINMASASAGWSSTVKCLDYHVDADWQTFGFNTRTPMALSGLTPLDPGSLDYIDTDAATEQLLGLYAGFKANFKGGLSAGLELSGRMQLWGDAAYMELSDPSGSYRLVDYGSKTKGLITALPYVHYAKGNFSAHAGAKLQISTGVDDKTFHAAPSVRLAWTPAAVAAVSLAVEGGNDFNTLRSLYDYSPWLPSNFSYERSYMPLDASLAINLGAWKGFSAELRARYAIANRWLMPFLAENVTDGTGLATFTTFGATDLKGFTGGLTLRYHPCRLIDVYAGADLAQQGFDKGYYLWRDRARYVVHCGAQSQPIDRLTLGIDWEYRGHRVYYAGNRPGADAREMTLGAVSDLGFKARWEFNSSLSVFADLHNLLCRRYETLPGLVSPGINGMVGAAYKF